MRSVESEEELLACEVCDRLVSALVNGMCGRCNDTVLVLDAREAQALCTIVSLSVVASGPSELVERLTPAVRRYADPRPSVGHTATLLRTAARELDRIPRELRSRVHRFGVVGDMLTLEPVALRKEADFIEQAVDRTAHVLGRVQP